MRFPHEGDPVLMPVKAPSRKLSDYLMEVQSKLSWTDQEMMDHMKVTAKEWNKIVLGGNEPSLLALSSFAETTEVDLNKLFDQTLDLTVMRERLCYKKPDSLPERYRAGAFSRMRTSRTLLEFIEFNFGWQMRQKVLKSLNMNESAIADPDRFINIRFFMDICESMKKFGYTDDVIEKMGRFSVYSNRKGIVGKMFLDCATPTQVYEKVVPVLGAFFDRNYEYSIVSLGPNHCIMDARLQEELKYELKTHRIGSVEGCAARGGVASSFALYAGDFPTKVTKLKCMHVEGNRCEYKIEWDGSRPQSSLLQSQSA